MSQIDFVVVSNDAIHNKLTERVIEKTYPTAGKQSFMDPLDALSFLQKKQVIDGQITILYVSIFMNPIDGFNFADELEKMHENIKKCLRLMLVAPGINKSDMKKAQLHNQVEYYMIAPLTSETIRLTVDTIKKRLGIQNP